MENMNESEKAFGRLLQIMNELREKCPWDRKQTIQTLRMLTLEETYELTDAIMDEDWPGLKEELGDLLLHIVFYSKIGSEKKSFDITNVIDDLCGKLIRRHPHIYGNVEAETDDVVKKNWEQIKMKERRRSVLEGVPVSLPAIVKAYRIQDKASQVGFEWEEKAEVWKKVEEELKEFAEYTEREIETDEQELMEKEFGDVLFSLVNLSRFLNIDPEAALEKTNRKFKKRFEMMEAMAAKENRQLKEMTLEQMDALWNETKKVIQ